MPQFDAALLGGFFVTAKIKNQKGMCHALQFGGRCAVCQDRKVGAMSRNNVPRREAVSSNSHSLTMN
jgi:hypothetical protein